MWWTTLLQSLRQMLWSRLRNPCPHRVILTGSTGGAGGSGAGEAAVTGAGAACAGSGAGAATSSAGTVLGGFGLFLEPGGRPRLLGAGGGAGGSAACRPKSAPCATWSGRTATWNSSRETRLKCKRERMMPLERRNEPQMLRQFSRIYPSFNLNPLLRRRHQQLVEAQAFNEWLSQRRLRQEGESYADEIGRMTEAVNRRIPQLRYAPAEPRAYIEWRGTWSREETVATARCSED